MAAAIPEQQRQLGSGLPRITFTLDRKRTPEMLPDTLDQQQHQQQDGLKAEVKCQAGRLCFDNCVRVDLFTIFVVSFHLLGD